MAESGFNAMAKDYKQRLGRTVKKRPCLLTPDAKFQHRKTQNLQEKVKA
ncbi:hypothetical protein [Pseudomonas asplenii]|nr:MULTISPECIES: hypothetical protein [Pseudomonas]UZE31702.1 hypothetical protein LOY63_13590 [Pseudomonas asplenii]